MTRHVAILVFDGVEVLDFAGPYEVFTTATRVQQRLQPQAPALFATQCVARSTDNISARAGLSIKPDASFADCPQTDLLIIPGGVVDAPMACEATREWIGRLACTAGQVASVCTGAFLLARSGVLHNGPVTTHWEDVEDLQRMFPALQVQTGPRWVQQGRITTSAGISAGMDMSLQLVAQLAGSAGLELAQRTARQMDYAWQQTP